MGILRTKRFKENIPFEVKDFRDEPIRAVMTVKEVHITEFDSLSPFKRKSLFKTGSEYTFKSIKSK